MHNSFPMHIVKLFGSYMITIMLVTYMVVTCITHKINTRIHAQSHTYNNMYMYACITT